MATWLSDGFGSLNEALTEISEDYILRQDADDFSALDRLAKKLPLMESDPKIAAVGEANLYVDAAAGGAHRAGSDFGSGAPECRLSVQHGSSRRGN